jgi:hypothetical protein
MPQIRPHEDNDQHARSWRPLNGLPGVIGMEFYATTRPCPGLRNGTQMGEARTSRYGSHDVAAAKHI